MTISINPAYALVIIFVIYTVLMLSALITVRMRNSKNYRERDDIRHEKKFKAKFFRSLTEGFQLESIKSSDDILNIYEAISNLSQEDINYRYGLSRYLREYLIALISKDEKIIPKSTSDEEIQGWKRILDRIISENDIKMPFSDLPPLERNISNDILVFLERDDKEHVRDKLKELSRLIRSRDGELSRACRRTESSMQLTLVSLFISLIFGIIAISAYF